MHKKESMGRRAGSRAGMLFAAALALIIPLFSGCSAPRDMAQAQPVEGSPTALIATPSTTAGALSAETPSVVATGTVTGTVAVLPTPSGTPPSAFDTLNTFQYVPSGKSLAKRDRVQLDEPGANAGEVEILLTITGPSETITDATDSRIGVLSYDSVYRQWDLGWTSEVVSGTATPLLNIGQKDIGGFNGGDLLRTGDPILVVRTVMDDGGAHLHMWRWNKQSREAAPVKKLNEGSDTVFEADLDINLMDIDDDGIYEVVADNLSGVQIWKWDGNIFKLEGER
ncbi:MAG: hypothetical protein ABIO92_07520 [Chloroflexia bacterium]